MPAFQLLPINVHIQSRYGKNKHLEKLHIRAFFTLINWISILSAGYNLFTHLLHFCGLSSWKFFLGVAKSLTRALAVAFIAALLIGLIGSWFPQTNLGLLKQNLKSNAGFQNIFLLLCFWQFLTWPQIFSSIIPHQRNLFTYFLKIYWPCCDEIKKKRGTIKKADSRYTLSLHFETTYSIVAQMAFDIFGWASCRILHLN